MDSAAGLRALSQAQSALRGLVVGLLAPPPSASAPQKRTPAQPEARQALPQRPPRTAAACAAFSTAGSPHPSPSAPHHARPAPQLSPAPASATRGLCT